MQSPPSTSKVRELFEAALELPAEQRAEFIDRCSGDAALRAAVEALLAAHETAGEVLADPTIRPDQSDHADALPPGARVGSYTVLRSIGEGGFSTVYLAQQDPPLARRGALKIIKPGMDTRQVIARFELERAALALMEHPNIAAVYDAGSTDAGRPYFVMELVEGRSITDFCRAFELDLKTRLGLFMAVCSAVQHAHERGVIHRDLKPANVLVALKDGNPVPKVIDFGIAKALAPQTARDVLAAVTMYPQFLGTPQYMAPEQAEATADSHVDSRSDVYSLGTMLYELLADVPPFDPQAISAAGYANLHQVLRDLDPSPPSTRVSGRSRSLARRIRGDLDWIALKAMAKEPDRRYPSADALSADIARHLADEPVSAGPPGAAYRMRKFVRRHRYALTMCAVAAVALTVGAVVTRLNANRAVELPARAASSRQPAPPLPATTSAVLEPGLLAEIYSGHFDTPASKRVDDRVDFTWPRGVPPADGVTVPHYSIRWSGVIVIPSGGALAIGIDADDGARLRIDGNLLAEVHDTGRKLAREPLQAGAHAIQLEYWNRLAQGHVMLIWILSGKQVKVVPAEALFHNESR